MRCSQSDATTLMQLSVISGSSSASVTGWRGWEPSWSEGSPQTSAGSLCRTTGRQTQVMLQQEIWKTTCGAADQSDYRATCGAGRLWAQWSRWWRRRRRRRVKTQQPQSNRTTPRSPRRSSLQTQTQTSHLRGNEGAGVKGEGADSDELCHGSGLVTVGDPVDGLSWSPQAAQDVVTVDVDGHSDHKQKQTCVTDKQEVSDALTSDRKCAEDVTWPVTSSFQMF